LEKLGYNSKAYQENIRTSYTLNNCEIEIDERPMIPAYLEIE
jgi:adenylate cyclase class 2